MSQLLSHPAHQTCLAARQSASDLVQLSQAEGGWGWGWSGDCGVFPHPLTQGSWDFVAQLAVEGCSPEAGSGPLFLDKFFL